MTKTLRRFIVCDVPDPVSPRKAPAPAGGRRLAAAMRGIAVFTALVAYPAAARGQDGVDGGQPADGCRFTVSGTVMVLQRDCTTSTSIEIPDGMTLDGHRHAIIAVDVPEAAFRGGVVIARGAAASIVDTTITAMLESTVCRTGPDRLRGIYFEGASGVIRGNIVDNVNRGASGCEEGNAIEVWHEKSDDRRATVEIAGNVLDRYQKTGIVAHGNVDVFIYSNDVGSSIAQQWVAANGVQVGPGARGTIRGNVISTNAYGGRDTSGSGILLIETALGTVVSANAIGGSGDVGIHVLADNVVVEDNSVADSGPDGEYDVGIVNLGEGNVFSNNTVTGFRTPYYGLENAARSGAKRIE